MSQFIDHGRTVYIIQTQKVLNKLVDRKILTWTQVAAMQRGIMQPVADGTFPYPWDKNTRVTVHNPLK